MIHLQAKKSLGQNFLIDPKAHQRIVNKLAPSSEDVIVEIGPGTGLLTRELLQTPLKKLIAFELDDRAVPLLTEEFGDATDRFQVLQQDFLTVDLAALRESAGRKLRIVGNIPYYITSPILFKLIENREHIADAFMLVQLEVAERLAAVPRTKAYGIPTVLANFFGTVDFQFKVPAGSFRPVPKVDSAVIHIDFARDYFVREGEVVPADFDAKKFTRLVRSAFAMRRKTLRNNLKQFVQPAVTTALETHPTGSRFLTQRAEELSAREFLELNETLQTLERETNPGAQPL